MSEALFSRQVIRALSGLDATSIEVNDTRGIPDISYAGGWIELKQYSDSESEPGIRDMRRHREWEQRACLSHFTVEQRAWLNERWDLGEDCWLLLRLGHVSNAMWFLYDGYTASYKKFGFYHWLRNHGDEQERIIEKTKKGSILTGNIKELHVLSDFLMDRQKERCRVFRNLDEK